MLVRKSLYGNMRPTPGDLYDPRDGTCLPNFHLSTKHNPIIKSIEQDLVKYDIQLVRELPSVTSQEGKQKIVSSNPYVETHSLMLLAVAEYSETLPPERKSMEPFVIDRVFFREAVAGILNMRYNVGDSDIAMLQNCLRKCLPDPATLGGMILEQLNIAISKVSIIQHGQEYHYTNIRMAFTEISKIINQVCSPQNMNARSVLVNLPHGASYAILDRNKYLAYLYEKQRRIREEEKQRRRQEQLRLRDEQLYLRQLELQRELEEKNSPLMHPDEYSRYSRDYSSQTESVSSFSQTTENTYRSQYIYYPKETSIMTVNGKKVIIYHDTGETLDYNDYLALQENSLDRRNRNIIGNQDPNIKVHKNFSKSTPNLADDEAYFGQNYASSFDDDIDYDNSQHRLYESYLKGRSKSVGDLREKDKIDRYPALLIEPGRKQIRKITETQEEYDKWRKKSPNYWGAQDSDRNQKEGTQKVSSNNSHIAQSGTVPHRSHPTTRQKVTQSQSLGHHLPVQNKPSIPPKYLNAPKPNAPADKSRIRRSSGDSMASTFSDISVSSQLQRDADKNFNTLYKSVIQKTISGTSSGIKKKTGAERSEYFGESDSSYLFEPTPAGSPEPIGADTLDREFVFRAYPVHIRDVK